MSYCPACNGIENISQNCPSCGSLMEDKGRWFDYFDDYSAYMPINTMKLFDGIQNDLQQETCPHLLYCENCHNDSVILIQEQK
ncbi:DNA-directed RNA polymerase subunit M/transcription elongation factor TFIIS [Evansella vedderi]|uniref:DNA-directed RNA polymerase subunit M/transcription elongation factor TFIIS n=1 Tax=Evansella vedderi TaxID=38282 RepID=A0ABT9ZSH9_9BACI|nr:hypothetical protein [Evansella vedderi]MDQ0254191.1 DNA-directed RNA polymerase subunit M/transcription elongation factor TFIIS [Evansella vedderi]